MSSRPSLAATRPISAPSPPARMATGSAAGALSASWTTVFSGVTRAMPTQRELASDKPREVCSGEVRASSGEVGNQ